MSASASASDSSFPSHAFPNPGAFTTFLSQNHDSLPGLFLLLAKKASGIPTIIAAEAVECALCYGWIDGVAGAVDHQYWSVRYTPRRAKSLWSKINVDRVEKLIKEGRMTDAGMRCVEEAKEDGRWDRAYDGTTIPEDFQAVLDGDKEVRGVFEGLNRSQRYAVVWRVQTASVKNRGNVIDRVVEMLGRGEVTGEGWKSKGTEEKKNLEKGRVKAKPSKAKVTMETKVEKDGVKKVTVKTKAVKMKSTATKVRAVQAAADTDAVVVKGRRPGLRSTG